MTAINSGAKEALAKLSMGFSKIPGYYMEVKPLWQWIVPGVLILLHRALWNKFDVLRLNPAEDQWPAFGRRQF